MEPDQIQNPQLERKSIVKTGKVIFKRGFLYLSIFTILILLVLGAGDRYIRRFNGPKPIVHEVKVLPTILYEQLNKDVLDLLTNAESAAIQRADRELSSYFNELLINTEDSFIKWYFCYLNQQMMIANYLINLMRGKEYAHDQLVVRIEQEFSNRVFSPQTAELRFQRLVDDTTAFYVEQVRTGIHEISLKYRIPAEPWAEYLASIGGIVVNVNPTRTVSVGTKVAVAAGTYAAIAGGRMLADLIKVLIRKLTTRIAAETVEVTAARAGTVAVAEIAGRTLLPVLTAGLIAWEWYDHQKTVKEQTPVLLNAVHEFFNELKKKLLADIKGVLTELKTSVARNMGSKQ